jgi:hypothetical protein
VGPGRRVRAHGRPQGPARGDAARISVYVIGVSEETIDGRPVTDAQIQAWADEAEAGYPAATLRRRGRPVKGSGPGEVVPTRLDPTLLAALDAQAKAEGLPNRSEAIRAAVRAWTHVA